MHRIGLISVFFTLIFFSAKAAIITSAVTGGAWNVPSTWAGGNVPGGTDDVVIAAGSTVLLEANNVTSGIKSLTIQKDGNVTMAGANNIKLNIKGDIINNGTLNLWINESQGAALYILGASTWGGTGIWNLAQINISGNSVEFASGLTVTINRGINVTANTGSLNMLNKRPDITFIFGGSENGTIASRGDRVFYGNIYVRKTEKDAAITFAITGTTAAYNTISVLGDIIPDSPVNIRTALEISNFNILDVKYNLYGNGRLVGGAQSDIIINGNGAAPHINMGDGTLRNLIINRPAGAILDSTVNIQQTLALNNACRLILPSGNNFNLTIGVDGLAGTITGNGYLVQPPWTLVKELADITILGNAPNVDLRFSQTGTENMIHVLTINKSSGSVNLIDGGTLQVRNNFVFTKGIFSIGSGTLKLTGPVSTNINSLFRGSTNANLFIGNEVSAANATLYFEQLDASAQTLKTYKQLRNGIITLGNNLNIIESLDLLGGTVGNILNSNGKLTLLSTASQTACVNNLGMSFITGNVNVQRYTSGGSTAYRGYRLISSPVATGAGVYNFQHLKNGSFLSGAADGGFDKTGNPTIYLYREDVKPSNAAFTAGNFKGVAKINYTDANDIGTQKHGTVTNTADTIARFPVGNGALFFFRGDRFNNITQKTQPPFAAAEAVCFSSSGLLNQKNITVKIWYKNSTFLGFTNYSAANATVRGYNLVGNPYASTIDWNSNSANGETGILFSNAADIDQKVFYLNNINPNQNYLWYDAATGLGSDPKASRYIASGQGFFIRAKTASATITFTENAKTTLQPPTLLMGFPQKQTAKPGFYIKLKQDTVIHDYCSIYFDKNWSAAYTDDDAPDMDGATPQLFLSSFSSDGKRLAINKMAAVDSVTVIPIYVDAAKTGNYFLSLEQIKGFAKPGFSIWLKDMSLKDSLEMGKEKTYSFFIDKNKPESYGAKRFVLLIRKEKPRLVNIISLTDTVSQGIQTGVVYPNPATNFIRLKQHAAGHYSRASIINSTGRTVFAIQNILNLTNNGVDVRTLMPGLYYLQVWANNNFIKTIPFIKL